MEGYVKALHALGYTVNYGTPVDKRRHDGEKGTSEILCLEELCEKKPEEGRSFFGSPKVTEIAYIPLIESNSTKISNESFCFPADVFESLYWAEKNAGNWIAEGRKKFR